MLRLVALTHHHTTDQRYIPLDFFEVSPGSDEVQLPANSNVLIPGNYWVFGLDADGVPSEGSTLMIETTADKVGDFVDTEIVINSVEGNDVAYEYYEGDWNALPDFDALTPVTTGDQADYSLDAAQQADFFAFRFTSTVELDNAGAYTFSTKSDDGSQVFVNGQLVVNNDGLHGARLEKEGVINLAAGTHEIVVTFFERLGLNTLKVRLEGPSVVKQDVAALIVEQDAVDVTDVQSVDNRLDNPAAALPVDSAPVTPADF